MPFDGAGFALRDDLEKIDTVIELIRTPGQWCKGTLRTRDGRYCLRGAIQAVGAQSLAPVVLQAIRERTGKEFRCIESFNDNAKTTHEQVYTVLRRTREYILAGKGPAQKNLHNVHSMLRRWLDMAKCWLLEGVCESP